MTKPHSPKQPVTVRTTIQVVPKRSFAGFGSVVGKTITTTREVFKGAKRVSKKVHTHSITN